MEFTTEDFVRAQALWLALETFPDDALQELVDGEEVAIRALRGYAQAILHRRRMAEGAESN